MTQLEGTSREIAFEYQGRCMPMRQFVGRSCWCLAKVSRLAPSNITWTRHITDNEANASVQRLTVPSITWSRVGRCSACRSSQFHATGCSSTENFPSSLVSLTSLPPSPTSKLNKHLQTRAWAAFHDTTRSATSVTLLSGGYRKLLCQPTTCTIAWRE